MCFQQSAIIYYRVECQSCEGLPELDRLLGIIVLARVLLPELDGEDGGVEAEEDAEGKRHPLDDHPGHQAEYLVGGRHSMGCGRYVSA